MLELTFFGLLIGGGKLRADWVSDDIFHMLLTALMPENRLALEVSLSTGLRIDDVLSLRTKDVQKQRFTVREQKTLKPKRVYLPMKLWKRLRRNAGAVYVFEGRLSPDRHRTRQTVYKDLVRVSKLYRIEGAKVRAHVSPHTARKIYAVNLFHDTGDLAEVQQRLNHSDSAVTMLYAMADVLTARRKKRPEKP